MSGVALDIRDLPEAPPAADADGRETGEDTAEADAGRTEARAVAAIPPTPARLRCATCGTVLTADAPAGDPRDEEGGDTGAVWRVPVHAVLPSAVDPFAARPCPGSGRAADPTADAVAAPDPGAPPRPAAILPLGLHWRDQPFSHGLG